jgi:hypothetical protein
LTIDQDEIERLEDAKRKLDTKIKDQEKSQIKEKKNWDKNLNKQDKKLEEMK